MNIPFIYPFPESEQYKLSQQSLNEVFNGGCPFDKRGTLTPTLPINALILQVQQIIQNLLQVRPIERDFFVLNEGFLSRIQVFLVTEQNIGHTHEVINLFTQQRTMETVPNLNKQEPNSPDYLGRYVSQSGAIYIRIEKLYDKPLILQKVLLHEFIHLLFDVVRRNTSLSEMPQEEMYDNFLVLHCYSHALVDCASEKEYIFNAIRDFISSQPQPYNKALDQFDDVSSWFKARKVLMDIFQKQD